MWLLALAHAGVVTSVPPGETRVGLLLCKTEEPCAELAWWIETLDSERSRPLLILDSVLELDGAEVEDGETLAARFAEAMGRARAAWAAKRWNEAEFALNDAEGFLRRWSGTAGSQDLFELWYWRGAIRLARGESPSADFRQAAASAWNREVTLPVEDEAAAKAYYAELALFVGEGTGTIRFAEPPSGAVWYLDGVELGGGAYDVTVFPAVHRVTAVHAGMIRTWKKDVQVQARRTREVSAAFSPADEARWLRAQLRAAFDGASLPKEVKELLSAWCSRHGLHELRVLMVEESGELRRLRALVYDPNLRRAHVEG